MPFIKRTSGFRYMREVVHSKKHLEDLKSQRKRRRFSGTGGYRLPGEIRRLQSLIDNQEQGRHYVYSDDALGVTCSCGLTVASSDAQVDFLKQKGHIGLRTKRLLSQHTLVRARVELDSDGLRSWREPGEETVA